MVSGTRVIASVNIASTRADRRIGMKAFPDASVPLVIQPCNWVHSFGLKFPIDVIYLDADDLIIDVALLRPNRLAFPRRHAVRVVETAPGATRHWGLKIGDTLTFRSVEIPTERDQDPAR
jgi:uncharacterized protein